MYVEINNILEEYNNLFDEVYSFSSNIPDDVCEQMLIQKMEEIKPKLYPYEHKIYVNIIEYLQKIINEENYINNPKIMSSLILDNDYFNLVNNLLFKIGKFEVKSFINESITEDLKNFLICKLGKNLIQLMIKKYTNNMNNINITTENNIGGKHYNELLKKSGLTKKQIKNYLKLYNDIIKLITADFLNSDNQVDYFLRNLALNSNDSDMFAILIHPNNIFVPDNYTLISNIVSEYSKERYTLFDFILKHFEENN